MASYTYTAVGNREDLIDIITNISPDETVLMTKFGNTTAKAMTHSWLTDSLDAPVANKHLEDADFQTAAATPRVRLSNYIQIFMKGIYVTDSQEAVQKAGIKSELAYQTQKAMKAIARDTELALLANASMTAGDGSTAGQMAGVAYFNTSNAQAASGVLTEKLLNDAIQAAWVNGGTPEIVICSGKNKRLISSFTANTQKQQSADSKKLTNIIDINVGIAA